MTPSVVTYALDRLADLGIGHVFGVPGDYAFPINDAVEVHSRLTWVPSANELNAPILNSEQINQAVPGCRHHFKANLRADV